MPPLAGRPPFATDEPESFYETPRPSQAQRRGRPRQLAADGEKRTSAYDVYDHYLVDNNATGSSKQANPRSNPSRNSGGMGALGMGLLNMGDDSDDDDSYENEPVRGGQQNGGTRPRNLATPPGIPADSTSHFSPSPSRPDLSSRTPTTSSPSKNAALAAAMGVTPTTPTHHNTLHKQRPQQQQTSPQMPGQQMDSPPRQPHPQQQHLQQQMRAGPQPGAPPNNEQLLQQPVSPPRTTSLARGQQNGPGPGRGQERAVAPPFTHQQQNMPIVAPQPGYPAPIAALNLARSEHANIGPAPSSNGGPVPGRNPGPPGDFVGANRQQPIFRPAPLKINPRSATVGQNMPMPMYTANIPVPPSPAPSSPHPLHPPITPITAVFIKPKSAAPEPVSVKFEEEIGAVPIKPIMRGNSEDPLLPPRGEKGDDFWRRFSMVAKEDRNSRASESSWLRQTRKGSQAHSRWVWIVGMTLVVLILGGIGVGVYFTRNNPSHQQPTAIGGSADNVATASSSTTVKSGGQSTPSVLHVSPTNTVKRREDEGLASLPTIAPFLNSDPLELEEHLRKRRMDKSAW